jgi:two-component system, NtrC family, response regulator AtoC
MSSSHKTLLIIDDDKLFCDSVCTFFTKENFRTVAVNTGQLGLDWCEKNRVDVILLDQKLPDISGIDLCKKLLCLHEQVKIIFITAFPSFDHAVGALRNGAHDYLSKPLELEELILAINLAFRTVQLEKVEQVQNLKDNKDSLQNRLLGLEGGLESLRNLIERAAANWAPVLITGETGTGKTVVAKTIHYLQDKQSAPFIDINCAALPEGLIEAELFGYEKGAFTDAKDRRLGLFEMADGGTLFLDEIGELPLKLQAKLLGVLDNGTMRRLGGQMTLSTNARIIAATNIELEQAVKNKAFREDLYYRMSVMRIHIPPLRERKDDIDVLAHHFLTSIAPDRQLFISDEEISKLKKYSWPGNVRELKNIIERAIILSNDQTILPSTLIQKQDSQQINDFTINQHINDSDAVLSLAKVEKAHLLYALEKFEGNRSHAAKALGIARSTLIRKIEKYGISSTVAF